VTRPLSLALVLLALAAAAARAQPAQPEHPIGIELVDEARRAYEAGDFKTARELLLRAYALAAAPQLLFPLGQVEFNLGHYREAIDYYQRFLASNPADEQAALAQQAIGAARMKLAAVPPDTKQPPQAPVLVTKPGPPHRDWDSFDTAIAITGGAALVTGGGLFVTGSLLADDRSGTLHSYDTRVNDAHLARSVAIATTAAGALALGAAVIRWRFHLVSTTITIDASATHAGVVLEHPL